MDTINISNQTLKDFIEKPFNRKDFTKQTKYESRYLEYKRNNKIKLGGVLKFEDSFFIHVKVPSESNKKEVYYDVVVQFFTDNDLYKHSTTVKNYYVQFFSNSPGFLYKYAALYKLEGYLIESLADKFEPGILDVLPDKANKNYELAYDSSIYYGCRYIWDNKLNLFSKIYLSMWSRKSAKDYFENIQTFSDVNLSRDISNLEKQLRKEIQSDTKKLTNVDRLKIRTKNNEIAKQVANDRGIKKAKKKLAKVSTFKDQSKNSSRKTGTGRKAKITHTKSTRK